MKLSACYIVGKNETDFEKSLKSIYNSIDELIVINTGQDKNIAVLAEKYGARIYSFDWKNDFAAARNFALDHATGDWILFLDADEYIRTKQGCNLKELVALQGQTVDCFFIKIHNVDSDQGNKHLASFFAPRLFRNKQSIRYVGNIHEQLLEQGKPLAKYIFVKEADVEIIHTGYKSSLAQSKAMRNLKLLLSELERNKQPETLYMPLAEAYEGAGDFQNAIHYAKLSVELGRQPITYASRAYRILLRLMVGQEEEFLKITRAAVQDFPELPEFHAEHARCLADKFAYEEAIMEMEQAIDCYEKGGFIEPSIFDESTLLLAEQLIQRWQDMQAFEYTLRLSACAIAKNEEAEINCWIENMKRCTDEQILVDTGSTDRTVAIAKSAGIKVYHYSWQDDFSAARNFALEQATGDWIVFLDIDEYFTEKSLQYVRKVIAREHWRKDEVDAIICPLINIDVDEESREVNRFINLRLLRNEPYLRYRGNVHESLRNSNGKLKILQEQKYLQIYHTGYSSGRVQRKVQRDLALLLQDIKKNGESEAHYRYLADCYYALGEYEKSIKYAKLHLASNAVSIGSESEVFHKLIQSMDGLGKAEKEKQEHIEMAIEKFPELPDFYVYYGKSLLAQNHKVEAKKYFLKSLDIEAKREGALGDSSNFAQLKRYVYRQLIHMALENGDEFECYLSKALKDNLYDEEIFFCLQSFLRQKPIGNIIEFLEKYYGNEQQTLEFIANQWGGYQLDEVYFHYKERLKREYGVMDESTILLKILADKTNGEVFPQIMSFAVSKIKLLSYVVLKDKSLLENEDVIRVLPNSFLHCLESYHGIRNEISIMDFDGYLALLSCMEIFNDHTILHRFCELTELLSPQQIEQVAAFLCKQSFWEEAKLCYEKLFFKIDPKGNEEILYVAGLSAFYCKDFTRARDYLLQTKYLLQNGKNELSKLNEVNSYLIWLENEMN